MLRKIGLSLRRTVKGWELPSRAAAFLSRRRTLVRPLLFGAGFVLVVLLVHREVYSFITERRQFSVPEVRTAVAPEWADSRGEEVVVVDPGPGSLFDEDWVERVGRAFEASPWVRRVVSVEREFPSGLRIRVERRRPHVAVRRSDGHVVVDVEGVRLPGVYVDPPPGVRQAVLTGLTTAPPDPGRAWEDSALRAGLEMADLVQTDPSLRGLKIREVDLSNFGGRVDPRRSEVAFTAGNGCVVQWGRTEASARFGDIPREEKLATLRKILSAYPGLHGLRHVKLYFSGSGAVEPEDPHVNRRR